MEHGGVHISVYRKLPNVAGSGARRKPGQSRHIEIRGFLDFGNGWSNVDPARHLNIRGANCRERARPICGTSAGGTAAGPNANGGTAVSADRRTSTSHETKPKPKTDEKVAGAPDVVVDVRDRRASDDS